MLRMIMSALLLLATITVASAKTEIEMGEQLSKASMLLVTFVRCVIPSMSQPPTTDELKNASDSLYVIINLSGGYFDDVKAEAIKKAEQFKDTPMFCSFFKTDLSILAFKARKQNPAELDRFFKLNQGGL